jgi:hypothetical protein
VTRAVPLPRRRRYSTEREGETEKTTSRIPSRDKFAHDNGQGLAIVSKGNHAERRTEGAPTPEGQVPAAEVHSAPGRFWTAHLLLVQHRSSLITPAPHFHPFLR